MRHAIPFGSRAEAERAVAFVDSCGVDTARVWIDDRPPAPHRAITHLFKRRADEQPAWVVVEREAERVVDLLRPFGEGR